jgi:hypothetical protein
MLTRSFPSGFLGGGVGAGCARGGGGTCGSICRKTSGGGRNTREVWILSEGSAGAVSGTSTVQLASSVKITMWAMTEKRKPLR